MQINAFFFFFFESESCEWFCLQHGPRTAASVQLEVTWTAASEAQQALEGVPMLSGLAVSKNLLWYCIPVGGVSLAIDIFIELFICLFVLKINILGFFCCLDFYFFAWDKPSIWEISQLCGQPVDVNKVLANTIGIYSALQIRNISPACFMKGTKKHKLHSGWALLIVGIR